MISFTNSSPEDTSYLLNLPYHLANASMDDELCTILTDYDFINHKITVSSPQLLIEDYDLTQSSNSQIPEKEKESLKLIQAAISLSENILDEDKTQLAGQLLGRLLLFEIPVIQATLHQAKNHQRTEPWLRPLTSTLTPPGEPLLRTITGHNNWVTSVAITPDGDKFVSASEDATIKIWNLTSGSLIKTLTGHNNSINAVAIAPDGKTIISASDDKTLKIWNLETGEELLTIIGHTKSIRTVAIHPDGEIFISGSTDNSLKGWDIQTGQELHTFIGHGNSINSIAIAPSGKLIVSASDDKTVKIWDLQTGKILHDLIGHSGSILTVR